LFRLGAVAHLGKLVPKLVPTGTEESPVTQKASELNAMLTATEKVRKSSV
jgi:hypothetical protein